MLWLALTLATCLQPAPGVAPEHARNPIYGELLRGISFSGSTIRLPEPLLADGQDAAQSRAVLEQVAGGATQARELTRKSVTAPFVLKTRDTKIESSVIRQADLWFVVHADLAAIDPVEALQQANDRTVEVGNMRFSTQRLAPADLPQPPSFVSPSGAVAEWYVHLTGRLLDRIVVEGTDHAVATRSSDSLVVASKTDPLFNLDQRFPNRWARLTRRGSDETLGESKAYAGSFSYAKITKLACEPGALLVEIHFAFVEPVDWFQGNPILRSKFSLIAQDQIRRLRREIELREKRK
jgi:hypothetical protein